MRWAYMIGPSFLGRWMSTVAAPASAGRLFSFQSDSGVEEPTAARNRATKRALLRRGPSRSSRTIYLTFTSGLEPRHAEARRDQRPGAAGWGYCATEKYS